MLLVFLIFGEFLVTNRFEHFLGWSLLDSYDELFYYVEIEVAAECVSGSGD